MMAPAMTTAADDRLAYASLARHAVHVERRLPAGALHRLEELAPADGEGTVRLDFRIDEQGRAWVRGHVEQPVNAACQRCLERFGLDGIASLAFARPITARHWLQASNPSERWKWDFMFQDLPPVKGAVDPSSLPTPPGAIPLREVK